MASGALHIYLTGDVCSWAPQALKQKAMGAPWLETVRFFNSGKGVNYNGGPEPDGAAHTVVHI